MRLKKLVKGKSIIAGFLATAICISLCGCGEKQEDFAGYGNIEAGESAGSSSEAVADQSQDSEATEDSTNEIIVVNQAGDTGTLKNIEWNDTGLKVQGIDITPSIINSTTVYMDDPKISMICIVYRPTKKQYGSNTAGPIVKEITEKSLQYMGVEKVYSKEEQKKNKKNYVKVPDVTGEDSNVAINTLKYKELKHIVMPESDDNKSFVVVDQYPKAGTKVEKGSSVYIYSE